MSKFIASVSLLVLAVLCTLGNFWFTYGIWPQSWVAFVTFSVIYLLILTARIAIDSEKK